MAIKKYKNIKDIKATTKVTGTYKHFDETKRAKAKSRPIGELEIIKMINNEVRKIKSKMKTLEKNNLTDTPFYKKMKRAIKDNEFSVAGKSLSELSKLWSTTKSYNAMKTSKKKGAQEYQEQKKKHDDIWQNLSPDDKEKLEMLYNTFIEENPYWLNVMSFMNITKIMYEVIVNNPKATLSEAIVIVSQKLNEAYEEYFGFNEPELKGGFKI